MALIIELSPDEEARLAAAARLRGITPVKAAHDILTRHLPPAAPTEEVEEEDPTLALFAQWDKEDEGMSPQVMEEERRSFEEFKRNINAERKRAGSRLLY